MRQQMPSAVSGQNTKELNRKHTASMNSDMLVRTKPNALLPLAFFAFSE